MALIDRARALAGRAGSALRSFAVTSPPAEGFNPHSPDRADRNPDTTRRLRGLDALFGRVSYGAGPAQTRYSSYVGTGIEPQAIWSTIQTRNNGYPQPWADLCEQTIERDGHLGGIYDTRRQAVADKPFRVHPARRGDDLSESLAKFAERVVDRVDSFDQSIEDLLSASAFGYAISEIVWAWDRVRFPLPNGQSATVTVKVPRAIDWVHWKHVRFDRNTDEPYLWLNNGDYTLPPHKFIFHAAAGTGLIERRGFMGACVWLSSAKRWSERDWLVYAKLFGIPNIWATFPDGQEEYEEHREKYTQFLKDYGEGIPALLPEGFQVQISREAGGRSNDLHGSIIGWANAEMSKRVLGSTLTVEMGGQGSWAAADTHRDAPYVRSRADARKLASTIRRDLLRAIVEVNADELAAALGERPESLADAVPRCSWRIEREASTSDRQRVYEGAVNELGLEIDEEQYRDEMGLDAPRPGGKKLRGRAETVSSGGAAVSAIDVATTGGVKVEKDDAATSASDKTPSESTSTTTATVELTPSDLAIVVTVNEARAAQGLPPWPDDDGKLTVAEFKAKHADTVATAAAAEDGNESPQPATEPGAKPAEEP